MMQALAGKRDELVKERQMESAFNVGRGRPGMLIFTHDQGAAWNMIALDAWRDWRQYGELQMIPAGRVGRRREEGRLRRTPMPSASTCAASSQRTTIHWGRLCTFTR